MRLVFSYESIWHGLTESIFCTNPMNFSCVPLILCEEEFKDFSGNKTWLCYLNFENEKCHSSFSMKNKQSFSLNPASKLDTDT